MFTQRFASCGVASDGRIPVQGISKGFRSLFRLHLVPKWVGEALMPRTILIAVLLVFRCQEGPKRRAIHFPIDTCQRLNIRAGGTSTADERKLGCVMIYYMVLSRQTFGVFGVPHDS